MGTENMIEPFIGGHFNKEKVQKVEDIEDNKLDIDQLQMLQSQALDGDSGDAQLEDISGCKRNLSNDNGHTSKKRSRQ